MNDTVAPVIKRVVYSNDDPDLPFQDQLYPLLLLQALSPQVIGNDPPGSMAGMFAGRLGGEQVLLVKFVFMLVGFRLSHPEFAPDQKAPVNEHGEKPPPGTKFYYAHQGKPRSGFYTLDGNQIVPTVNGYMLVEHGGQWHPSGFRFSRSAHAIGRQLGTRAAAFTATIEGESVKRCTVGKCEMTAERKTENGRTYYVPKPTLLGVVGEPNGPTLAEYRFADRLRQAFKAGEPWAELEPPEPPAIQAPATVVIEAEPPPADDNPSGARALPRR
jgi:hypothetical protein